MGRGVMVRNPILHQFVSPKSQQFLHQFFFGFVRNCFLLDSEVIRICLLKVKSAATSGIARYLTGLSGCW